MVLRKCPRCDGWGYEGGPFGLFLGEKCPLCHGTGYIDDGTIDIRVRRRYEDE